MKTKTKLFVIVALAALMAGIAILCTPKMAAQETKKPAQEQTKSDCLRTPGTNDWVCGDLWAAYRMEKWEREQSEKPKAKEIKAVITHYERSNSCHNPKKVNGKTLCLTAIGKDTQEGVTVACPRDIGLGTKVEIHGRTYVCQDRTARWVQERNGPTFDIFFENGDVPSWGKLTTNVTILP